MIKIAHRVNTIDLLKKTPLDLGVEIDIRSNGNDLILHHDPFEDGVLFKDWLKYFSHKTVILNVKEEGLELRVLKLMKENNISDFFFLDQSFPFLLKTALLGETRCAVRVSEYEDIQTALSLSNMIDWVWVDCFTKFPLNAHDANKLIPLSEKAQNDKNDDWYGYLPDSLIMHRREHFDTSLVTKLHSEKNLAPAEWGFYQVMSEPYGDIHTSIHGGAHIAR
mgnify:CR=1 FL=1